VLRADQDMAVAMAQFAQFSAFYQGDAVTVAPVFARSANAARRAAQRLPRRTAQHEHRHPRSGPARRTLAAVHLRLAEAQGVLAQAAAQYAPTAPGQAATVVQASSLGAEDIVISHLINSLGSISASSCSTPGQLARADPGVAAARSTATSAQRSTVFQPAATAVVEFVPARRHRRDVQEHRLAQSLLRHPQDSNRWSAPWQAKTPGSPACAASKAGTRAEVELGRHDSEARTKINPLANWTWGDVWHTIALNQLRLQPPARRRSTPALAARPAPAPSAWAKTARAGRWWWEARSRQRVRPARHDGTPRDRIKESA